MAGNDRDHRVAEQINRRKSGGPASAILHPEIQRFGRAVLMGTRLWLASPGGHREPGLSGFVRDRRLALREGIGPEQRTRAFTYRVAFPLAHNVGYEEDWWTRCSNSSKKRPARALVRLTHFGRDGNPAFASELSRNGLESLVRFVIAVAKAGWKSTPRCSTSSSPIDAPRRVPEIQVRLPFVS
jgi:hypothetical protein